MNHRIGIASTTGLGPGPRTFWGLDNDEELISPHDPTVKAMLEDACSEFKLFREWCGCDFGFDGRVLSIGIEPSYMYQRLHVLQFDFSDKGASLEAIGYAWGPYGTEIAKKIKLYNEMKRSKAKRFIDKWYDKLKGVLCK